MPLDAENPLGFILSRTYLAFKRTNARTMKSYEITPEQYGVIRELNKSDGISQKRRAKLTERDQTTVGKILDKLTVKKLVNRTTDPNDRRAVLLYLTPKGRELIELLNPELVLIQEQAFKDFDENEIEIFIRAMDKIHRNVSQ
ncbi:DNA-binding MarR family transcriptional regulator [Paenibacillus sp. DS2015]|uniref:MarR family winged helix-turn-helix transcriptional regulator n=1 Tax=Paenibacillus sp. DS2015 TaxID=3373917 RepID=UPI003D25B0F8